jgi:hypothetical protein
MRKLKRYIKEKKCKEEVVWSVGTVRIKFIKPQKESHVAGIFLCAATFNDHNLPIMWV